MERQSIVGLKLYSLLVHPVTHSPEDIILNKDIFSNILIGDYVQISDPERPAAKLILKVNSFQSTSGRLEISISKPIAEVLNVQSFVRINLVKIDPTSAHIDFVELAFRRQFLQRGNMWRFKNSMLGFPIRIGQNVQIGGVQAQIEEISLKGEPLLSGVISEKTNFIFRSRSARIFWLIQISSEMWEVDDKGDMYFEKFLNKFIDPLFDRWKALSVSHSLTVAFFARSIITSPVDSLVSPDLSSKKSLQRGKDGVKFQDFFKIVIENTSDLDKLVHLRVLKREFWNFPKLTGWNVPNIQGNSKMTNFSIPSDAKNGNLLEAINTTLNVLDKHYMDRDLQRTGNSIVMISAGTGIFKVLPHISLITKQRMLDSGIGIDLISLSQPPLHYVPLFQVDCSSENDHDFYEIPHWIHVSYIDQVVPSQFHNSANSSGRSLSEESMPFFKNRWNYRWTGVQDFIPCPGASSTSNSGHEDLTSGGGAPNNNSTVQRRQKFVPEFSPLPFSDILNGSFAQRIVNTSNTMSEGPSYGGTSSCEHSSSCIPNPINVSSLSSSCSTSYKSFLSMNSSRVMPTTFVEHLRRLYGSPSVNVENSLLDESISFSDIPEWGQLYSLKKHMENQFNAQQSVLSCSIFKNYFDFKTLVASSPWYFNYMTSLPRYRHPHHSDRIHNNANQSHVNDKTSHCRETIGQNEARSEIENQNQLSSSFRERRPSGSQEWLSIHAKDIHKIPSNGVQSGKMVSSSMGPGAYGFPHSSTHSHSHPHPHSLTHRPNSQGNANGTSTLSQLFPSKHLEDSDGHGTDENGHGVAAMTNDRDKTYPIVDDEWIDQLDRVLEGDIETIDQIDDLSKVMELFDNNIASMHSDRSLHIRSWSINSFGSNPSSANFDSTLLQSISSRSKLSGSESGSYQASSSLPKNLNRSHSPANPISQHLHIHTTSNLNTTGNYSSSNSINRQNTTDRSVLLLGKYGVNGRPRSASSSPSSMSVLAKQMEIDRAQKEIESTTLHFSHAQSNEYSCANSGALDTEHDNSIAQSLDPSRLHGRSNILSGHKQENSYKRSSNSLKNDHDTPPPSYALSLHTNGQLHNVVAASKVTSTANTDIPVIDAKELLREFRGRTQCNPFRFEEGAQYLAMRTHNRRRWSHVFPSEKYEAMHSTFYGLDWKSLSQPVILPLVTDYLPTVAELNANYEIQTQYSVVLDQSSPFSTVESLLTEMVCQRLSMEFQIVEGLSAPDMIAYRGFFKNGSINQPKTNVSSLLLNEKNKSIDDSGDSYILSMGHRIQFLEHDRAEKKINVVQLRSKRGVNDSERIYTYCYELWVPQLTCFQTLTQKFCQFPSVEYQWNSADQIVSGDEELMDFTGDTTKAKRLRFVIIPEIPSASYTEEIFFSRLEKLFSFFNKYGSSAMEVEFENKTTNSSDTDKNKSKYSTNILKLWLCRPPHNNPKWAFLKYDARAAIHKVFHIEIHWLVCDSWLMDELVTLLYRRSSSWNLRVVQVPEFFCTSNLNVHPYRGQPYIPVPQSTQARHHPEYPTATAVVERIFFQSQTDVWMEDDEKKTDWEGLGIFYSDDNFPHPPSGLSFLSPLPLSANESQSMYPGKGMTTTSNSAKMIEPRTGVNGQMSKLNSHSSELVVALGSCCSGELAGKTTSSSSGTSNSIMRKSSRDRRDRQYIHRCGYASVRVGSMGFVWLLNSNARVNDINIAATEKHAIVQQKLEELIRSCDSIGFCYDICIDMIETAIATM